MIHVGVVAVVGVLGTGRSEDTHLIDTVALWKVTENQ